MANKDNSVNIKGGGAKASGAYHHGDLRAAVIAAGLERLAEGDGAELGLRALARDVGVSATALYRHFPDKEALLDALADEGLRRLGALQAQAWLKAGGGVAGFKATGIAYVRFAHDELKLIDAGDDVVALTRGRGVGASSGAGWESELGYVFTLEDGLIRKMRFYLGHQQALEAVGLSK